MLKIIKLEDCAICYLFCVLFAMRVEFVREKHIYVYNYMQFSFDFIWFCTRIQRVFIEPTSVVKNNTIPSCCAM